MREPLLAKGSVGTAALKKGLDHPVNNGIPNFGVD
jgi:hypothetical protein